MRTACSLDCFDACAVVADVRDGRIVKLAGDATHPYTRGSLCRKTNRYLEDRQYHRDRLRHPLRRTAGGFERIAWDDALDLIAERFDRVRRDHGPLAAMYHKGNGSFAALKLLCHRFFNMYGGATQAVGRYCAGEGDFGTTQSFGACEIHDPDDLAAHTALFLIWGRNPAVTNVHMLPILKSARTRGARAVLIDPVETRTARHCDRFVQPRPGSDGHLALGMARVIVDRRPVDRARIAAISEGFDDYLALVASTSLDDVCRRTDLPLATIEDLALAYADTKPATILQGIGLQQYTRGAQTYRLIAALGMLTGNIGVPGGGVNFANWPWADLVRAPVLQSDVPRRTVPVSQLGDALSSFTEPPIRVAMMFGSNLVNQMPDPEGSRRALSQLDFVVALDQFLTDTAACADVVLPSTTFLEEEDVLPSYGHHWMQLMRPVAPPLDECRTDLAVMQALADRLGFGKEMAGTPAEWIDRITEPMRAAGVSYAALAAAGGRLKPSDKPPVPWADGRFRTPSGRFSFPRTLDDDPVLPTPEYPLHLTALATDRAVNSQIPEERQEGLVAASVHPDTATALGLADGDAATVVSPRGRLAVRVRIDRRARVDSVLMPKGEWHRHGRSMNVLVEPRFTGGTGTAFNQNYVRLER
jgi:anaerobic selenocysteine-containing dehydrogenase